ncbi:alcohol dehydrogenase catalytic domain-containing protein [Nocardia sp. NPDC004260]
MRATYLYGPGDGRVIDVPDPVIHDATDAIVRVVRACVCGTDLHPYHSMAPTPRGSSMGHEFVGVVEDIGGDVHTVKKGDLVIAPFVWSDGTCDTLLPGVLDGRVEPGKVFDREAGLDQIAAAYRAMDSREALKVLVRP